MVRLRRDQRREDQRLLERLPGLQEHLVLLHSQTRTGPEVPRGCLRLPMHRWSVADTSRARRGGPHRKRFAMGDPDSTDRTMPVHARGLWHRKKAAGRMAPWSRCSCSRRQSRGPNVKRFVAGEDGVGEIQRQKVGQQPGSEDRCRRLRQSLAGTPKLAGDPRRVEPPCWWQAGASYCRKESTGHQQRSQRWWRRSVLRVC